MPVFARRQSKITIARWLLALFVIAWVNIIVQAPVHAAMKQSNDMPCHCDTTLCDTVLAMEEQSDDGLGFVFADSLIYQVAFVATFNTDAVETEVVTQFHKTTLDFRQHNPPPLLLNTILLI